MQVIAHKDPVTGQLFEHQKDLTAHQARERRRSAAEAERAEALARAAALRLTLVEELERLTQLPELARRMYDGKLASLRLRRGKTPLKVVEVRVSGESLSLSEQLRLDIAVVLDGVPEQTYLDDYIALYPHDVLHPFALWGSGGVSTEPGRCTYQASVTATLRSLPKLRATLRRAAQVLEAHADHTDAMRQAAEAMTQSDAEHRELEQSVQQARDALHNAQATFQAALQARARRFDALLEHASNTMPFAQALELPAARLHESFIGNAAFSLRRHAE